MSLHKIPREMTPLDKELRVKSDQQIADAKYACDALTDLILMAEKNDAYIKGYAYAAVAIVWARKEHDRLNRLIEAAPQTGGA